MPARDPAHVKASNTTQRATTAAAYLHDRVNERLRDCLLESEADRCFISIQWVRPTDLRSSTKMILAANGTNITIDGVATLLINLSKLRSTAYFIVSHNIDDIILGRDWLHENNIIWYFGQNTITIVDRRFKLRSVSTKS